MAIVWARIMTALKSKKPGLASFLAHSRMAGLTEKDLSIAVQGTSFQIGQIEKPENMSLIEKIAAEILERKVHVKVQAAEEVKGPQKAKAPAKKKAEDQDPLVQDALTDIWAERLSSRIRPKSKGVRNTNTYIYISNIFINPLIFCCKTRKYLLL